MGGVCCCALCWMEVVMGLEAMLSRVVHVARLSLSNRLPDNVGVLIVAS